MDTEVVMFPLYKMDEIDIPVEEPFLEKLIVIDKKIV